MMLGDDQTPPQLPSDSAGVEAEIKRFHTMMGDRSSQYWKGPSAARHQERYRLLLRGRG
jgi:hypothetical protein